MKEKQLIITFGDENGSFKYLLMGNDEVFYTNGLADLVN